MRKLFAWHIRQATTYALAACIFSVSASPVYALSCKTRTISEGYFASLLDRDIHIVRGKLVVEDGEPKNSNVGKPLKNHTISARLIGVQFFDGAFSEAIDWPISIDVQCSSFLRCGIIDYDNEQIFFVTKSAQDDFAHHVAPVCGKFTFPVRSEGELLRLSRISTKDLRFGFREVEGIHYFTRMLSP